MIYFSCFWFCFAISLIYRQLLKIRRVSKVMVGYYFFTLSDSGRHLSPSQSVLKKQDVAWVRKNLQAVFSLTLCNVTMHRCYSPASPIEIFTGDFFIPSLKDEICSPIIKNRLKTNF